MSSTKMLKCFQTIQKVNSHKLTKLLVLYDESLNMVTSKEDQIDIISIQFENLFSSLQTTVTPENILPFTVEEMKTAAQKT